MKIPEEPDNPLSTNSQTPAEIKADSGIKKSNGHGGRRPGAGRKPNKPIVALNPALTEKQKRYIEARVDGQTKADAAVAAGYSRSTNPYHIENHPNIQEAFRLLLNRKVSDERLADCIAEGLDATEKKFFSKDGIVTDEREVIDWNQRRQYAELAARAKQVIPKDGTSVDISIQQLINSIPDEWREKYLSGPDEEQPVRLLPQDQHEEWALSVFEKSHYTAAEFNRWRQYARAGRAPISNDDELNKFLRAEAARSANLYGDDDLMLPPK